MEKNIILNSSLFSNYDSYLNSVFNYLDNVSNLNKIKISFISTKYNFLHSFVNICNEEEFVLCFSDFYKLKVFEMIKNFIIDSSYIIDNTYEFNREIISLDRYDILFTDNDEYLLFLDFINNDFSSNRILKLVM